MLSFQPSVRTAGVSMRILAAICAILVVGLYAEPSAADPYKWCAVYGGSQGGSTNCYFTTLDQCHATVSGTGGFCQANGFYDGRPVETPGSASTSRRRSGR
jgi:hypothetical protein